MASTTKARAKGLTNQVLHKLGYQLSRYDPQHKEPKAFVDNVFGHRLYQNVDDIAINYGRFSGASLQKTGELNPEMGFMIRELKEGMHVIDIGANVGLMTLLLAKLVGPAGTVTSFEPGPVSFALLKLNTLINGYKNITLVEKAVSAASGMETLFICPTGESDNQVSATDLGWKDEVRIAVPIETVSLDDYFSGGNHRRIDFIKIDTQGGEYKALQGMQKLLARNHDIRLTIEYAPYLPLWNDLEPRVFLAFVRSLGFDIYDLESGKPERASDQYLIETFPRDGKVHRMTTLLLQRG